MSQNDKKAKTTVAGVDLTPLPPEVQRQIREAAERAARKAVQRMKDKALEREQERAKWANVAKAVETALTADQKTALEGRTIRLWFKDGKVSNWAVHKANNGQNGKANSVWYKEDDHYVEFNSAASLCRYLGYQINGDSAVRVLRKHNIAFVREKPSGTIVKAK